MRAVQHVERNRIPGTFVNEHYCLPERVIATYFYSINYCEMAEAADIDMGAFSRSAALARRAAETSRELLHERMLERLAAVLEAEPKFACAYCRSWRVSANDRLK